MKGSVVTLSEWCRQHGQDAGNWRRRAAAGIVPGAHKLGNMWVIPASTPAPTLRPRGRPTIQK